MTNRAAGRRRVARYRAWLALLLAGAVADAAPGPTPATRAPDHASLQRPLATWTQAEREYGFAHWAAFRPTRTVKRGSQVHPLPAGAPLPGFAPGGAEAAALDRYAEEFQLAGLVVLEDGRVRLERYGLGHSARGQWTSFSVAKSLTSTLVGAALRDGSIRSIEDPVTAYIPELKGSGYEGVNVRELLTMTSGVKWNEDYADVNSDVALFYSTPPEPGMDATVSYMRHLAREAPPGEKWLYKTGETHLIGVLLGRATGKTLAEYASEKIWAPYGMEQDASWQVDATGAEHGGCCFQATTRDFARIGEFIRGGARIDGQSIVADGWLEDATRKHADTGVANRGYGYQWWTRDDGTFDALGIHGQMIHIDRARRLVIALNSAWPVAIGQAQLDARLALVKRISAAVDAGKAR